MCYSIGEVGGLEQRFGWDAPPEDAGASEAVAFHDRGGETELGAPDGADVAGGAPADEDDVKRSHKPAGTSAS